MALKQEFEKQGNWLFIRRSYLPLVMLPAGVVVYLFTRNKSDIFVFNNTDYAFFYEILCLLVSFIGQFIRGYTVGYTPVNTSGRNTKEGQVADTVNTTGIYSAVRHPLYVGNYFMWLGIVMLAANMWFIIIFSLVFWVYYERIMFAEEQFLSRKFGALYDVWASITPAFIPSFKNLKRPVLSFSWKKVIKKEKNGIAALFLFFMFFDLLGKIALGKNNFNKFYIISTAVILVIFTVLTYLKRNTKLFEEEGR